ncbi:c-type heme family protein [Crocosphaera watsonii]|uniref:c-type heme family protein n=1 Tax=Crocosphaera watsonii TaxID=263511 RepID=UPI0005607A42
MQKLIQKLRVIKFPFRLITLILLGVASWFVVVSCGTLEAQQMGAKVPPDLVTDYIYRIIKSERTIYGKYVVQRLKDENVVRASEHWQQEKALPLPAQMFRMSSELASENSEFSYGAISPWSLNRNNIPNTDFEKKAMKEVLDTGLPYKDYQVKDGKKYFSALYPDKAVSAACMDCHNQHPIHKQRYPSKVFKVGDVMGGILINLPLED